MLLSIIIPTRNRYQYLTHLINSLYEIEDGDFEVVIQDNSDDNSEFCKFVKPFLGSKIKYFYNPESVSICENIDNAILSSTGEYVIVIGDDDGVSAHIMKMARWVKEYDYESCIWRSPTYAWPDFVDRIQLTKGMWLGNYKCRVKDVAVEEKYYKQLKKGGCRVWELPCVYQGIVCRSALDKVYNKAGSFSPGMCPDIANATALGAVIKKHAFIGVPYTVSGVGGASTFGGNNNLHPRIGEFGGHEGIDHDIEEQWDKKIPLVWTTTTTAAQAVITTLKAMGREKDIKHFNYNYLYGFFIAVDPQLFSLVRPLIRGLKGWFLFIVYLFYNLCYRTRLFISNFFFWRLNITGKKIFSDDVPTIREAVAMLDERIAKINLK